MDVYIADALYAAPLQAEQSEQTDIPTESFAAGITADEDWLLAPVDPLDELPESPIASLTSVLPSQVEAAVSVAATENPTDLGTLMVELRSVNSSQGDSERSALVKGAEDGQQALSLESWLVPFDDAIAALGFTASVQTDGRLELRSPEVVNHIDLASLRVDPELGAVWSVAELEALFGVSVEFDRVNYALHIKEAAISKGGSPGSTLPAFTSEYAFIHAESKSAKDSPAQTLTASPAPAISQNPEALGMMLVGLAIDDITTVEATLVKGRENGEAALAFDRWLIPFEDVMTALGSSVTPTDDGLLLIRAPGLATAIDPDTLQTDTDLGPVMSIAEIEKSLGITADFSFAQYAIRFHPPSLDQLNSANISGVSSRPVITDGLPAIAPAAVSLGGVRQATLVTGSSQSALTSTTAQLSAVGSAFDGSWYTRIDQPDAMKPSTWRLSELQYLRQGDYSDYVVGSQPTFWRSPVSDRTRSRYQNYWGLTTVQRRHVTPPDFTFRGGFNPGLRMQADTIGRTVVGEAAPGTFVQLTRGLNGSAIAETIVDASGIYRFENVPAAGQLSSQYSNQGYQVQLYANGQLASEPEIRSAVFTTLPGQLPKGASTLIASVGMGHRQLDQQFLGDFNSLRGGVAYRLGLSESLTVGAGLVQDGSLQTLSEVFYLPEGVPLQAAMSAMVNLQTGQAQIDANVRYQPARNLRLSFDSDRFSQRFQADWRLSPGLALLARGNTRARTLSVGMQTSYRTSSWSGSASAAVDTRQRIRWNLNTQTQRLRFAHQGNEISTYSDLVYRLSNKSQRIAGAGHTLALTHETRTHDLETVALGGGWAVIAQWRYQSPQRVDGQSKWRYALGYGIGSRRSGPVVSAATAIGQGLDLQVRYQGVSAFSDRDSFQISLVSHLGVQDSGIRNGGDRSPQRHLSLGHRHQAALRTQGGLILQPFLDADADGVRDISEPLYLEDSELLLQINHRALSTYQLAAQADGLMMTLPPDTYRLDIDPAGLPLDRTIASLAYAVEVVAGQYTAVPLPLLLSYSVSGVVVDASGAVVAGARVEAMSEQGDRKVSVTNGAGVYYLERLRPEVYKLEVNGVVLEHVPLILEGESEPFQEREIQLL